MSGRPTVHGVSLDRETRCAHYHSPQDIIAIRAECCDAFYACHECHVELADHAWIPIPELRWHVPGVLCGGCGTLLTVREYLGAGHACPACAAPFNPGCATHYHLYFASAR